MPPSMMIHSLKCPPSHPRARESLTECRHHSQQSANIIVNLFSYRRLFEFNLFINCCTIANVVWPCEWIRPLQLHITYGWLSTEAHSRHTERMSNEHHFTLKIMGPILMMMICIRIPNSFDFGNQHPMKWPSDWLTGWLAICIGWKSPLNYLHTINECNSRIEMNMKC